MSRNRFALGLTVLTATVLTTVDAAAQDTTSPGRLCLNNPQPQPTCSAIALTNVGAYYRAGQEYESHFRAIADWGLLMPVGSRSAIGASIFLSLDSDNLSLGPAIRYRHWSTDAKSSWEAGIGVPISDERTRAHGLLKWNASSLFGFAIRPELRRTYSLNYAPGCQAYSCQSEHTAAAVSFGVEVGGLPGLVLAAASAVGIFAAVVAISSSGN